MTKETFPNLSKISSESVSSGEADVRLIKNKDDLIEKMLGEWIKWYCWHVGIHEDYFHKVIDKFSWEQLKITIKTFI